MYTERQQKIMSPIFGNYFFKHEKYINICLKKHKLDSYTIQSIKHLLLNHPFFILDIYKPLIEFVVNKYAFDKMSRQDLAQDIYVTLFEKKINYITKNYNTDFEFTPYFLKIIMNTCLEILQKNKAQINTQLNDNHFVEENDEHESSSIIDEKIFIRDIIEHHKNSKILIAFKVFNKIPVYKKEITNVYKTISPWDLKKAENLLGNPDNSTINFFVSFMNKYDRTPKKIDSYRRQIQRYLHTILFYINVDGRNYSIKNITQILILIFNDQADYRLEKEIK